jgi:DNA-directed RNA polymerases I, II, and III subunit RPABC1
MMEKLDSGFSDADFNNYFKIRKTVLKMLEDRGYYISNEEKEKRLEDWKASHKKDILFYLLTTKLNDKDDLIYIESNNSPKLGVGDVTSFAERLHSQGVRNGIIILKGTITALAKQVKYFKIYFIKKKKFLIFLENF